MKLLFSVILYTLFIYSTSFAQATIYCEGDGFIKSGTVISSSDSCALDFPLKKVVSWGFTKIKDCVSDSGAEKKEYVSYLVREMSKIYWGMRVGPFIFRFINTYESVQEKKANKDRNEHYIILKLALKGNICIYDDFFRYNKEKNAYSTTSEHGFIYISKGIDGETKIASLNNLKGMIADDDETLSKLNAMDVKTWHSISDSKTFSQFMQIITLYNSLDKE